MKLLKGTVLSEMAEQQRSNEILRQAIESLKQAAQSEPEEGTTSKTRMEAYVLAARKMAFLGTKFW